MADSADREYAHRLESRRATRDLLDVADARFSYLRLATFGSGILLAILAWFGVADVLWLLLPVAPFIWLVRRHDEVLRGRDMADRGIAFYERGLARLEDRWAGGGEQGERFRDDNHVYSNDLDLFGRGSLFELLSLARTRTGEETLARWLKSPADAAEIHARQAASDELSSALDLRERFALAGASVRASVHTDRLLEWAQVRIPVDSGLRALTWVLTGAVLLAIAYAAFSGTWWSLGAITAVQVVVFARVRERINAILSTSDPGKTSHFVADELSNRTSDLAVVADLLKQLEEQPFKSAPLAALRSRLDARGQPASRVIGRLQRLSEIHDAQKNAALVPLMFFLYGELAIALSLAALLQLVHPHLALAVGSWRTRHGARVAMWINCISDFEALSSLACYRYEHSDDPFPEIVSVPVSSNKAGLFEGQQLGHPLLPRATMVRNDVRLGADMQLLVVSGSNMSGKSTLLRTVGINVVLALAGAPVRATSLRLTPLAIGATLRIQDSLQEGRSRFYAEITRIRKLADIAAGPVPLLFLLDEIFHGTNSHDRLQGAAGVLQGLLDRGAVGLITTHDLALTSVADELSPRATNVHFADWFEDGDIRFDYQMKPGPVTRSNAIALMRAVGLDVPART